MSDGCRFFAQNCSLAMQHCVLPLFLLLFSCSGNNQQAERPDEATDTPNETVDLDEEDVLTPAPVYKMEEAVEEEAPSPTEANRSADVLAPSSAVPTPVPHPGFTDLVSLDPGIRLDIKYATTDNFTKEKIYDCPRCLLRPEAADAIVKAQKILKKRGLGLKMFDCYRPRPYQQRLWDKVPNPDYVTPPSKGSMHSRGAAVDLTIVDARGNELDMGTPYDFFGPEAHTDNTSLSAQVLANRRMLQQTMATVGFKGIRTEWWHFSLQGKNWPLSDYVWPCDEPKH